MFLFLQLQISFEHPIIGSKDVMLDDITFDYCAEGDVPPGSEQLSCNFENDTCSWYHDYTASLLWKRTKHELNGRPPENGEYLIDSGLECCPSNDIVAALLSFLISLI